MILSWYMYCKFLQQPPVLSSYTNPSSQPHLPSCRHWALGYVHESATDVHGPPYVVSSAISIELALIVTSRETFIHVVQSYLFLYTCGVCVFLWLDVGVCPQKTNSSQCLKRDIRDKCSTQCLFVINSE